MLGLVVGPDPVSVQKLFPYRVSCDRAFNRRIEAAAKKAGMTPGQFVQAHFETIFDKAAAETQAAWVRGLAGADPLSFSRKHGVTLMAARAFIHLAAGADEHGFVKATLLALARAGGGDNSTTGQRLRAELIAAGLIAAVQRSFGNGGSTYRIVRAP